MTNLNQTEIESREPKATHRLGFLVDLILYISVMFLIREIYFEGYHFLVSGLFWTFSTLAIAAWRMKARKVAWADIGLRQPKSLKRTLIISGLILLGTIGSIMIFHLVKDHLPIRSEPDVTSVDSGAKFGELKVNWWLFLSIMPFVLIESALEEILDRGFLIHWLEQLFTKTHVTTILAVLLQAALFGFRHSNDLSERSITVGLIGLVMGIAYVTSGRNLWPLIIAHCVLNTMSMLDRV